MGFINWVKRISETKKIENDAKAEAMKSYYQSDEYKQDIIKAHKQKLAEGNGSEFGSWLKKVSKNAANSFNNESLKIDTNKILGTQSNLKDKLKK